MLRFDLVCLLWEWRELLRLTRLVELVLGEVAFGDVALGDLTSGEAFDETLGDVAFGDSRIGLSSEINIRFIVRGG